MLHTDTSKKPHTDDIALNLNFGDVSPFQVKMRSHKTIRVSAIHPHETQDRDFWETHEKLEVVLVD